MFEFAKLLTNIQLEDTINFENNYNLTNLEANNNTSNKIVIYLNSNDEVIDKKFTSNVKRLSIIASNTKKTKSKTLTSLSTKNDRQNKIEALAKNKVENNIKEINNKLTKILFVKRNQKSKSKASTKNASKNDRKKSKNETTLTLSIKSDQKNKNKRITTLAKEVDKLLERFSNVQWNMFVYFVNTIFI